MRSLQRHFVSGLIRWGEIGCQSLLGVRVIDLRCLPENKSEHAKKSGVIFLTACIVFYDSFVGGFLFIQVFVISKLGFIFLISGINL